MIYSKNCFTNYILKSMQFITVFLKDLIIITCNKAWFKIQNLRASSKTAKQ